MQEFAIICLAVLFLGRLFDWSESQDCNGSKQADWERMMDSRSEEDIKRRCYYKKPDSMKEETFDRLMKKYGLGEPISLKESSELST